MFESGSSDLSATLTDTNCWWRINIYAGKPCDTLTVWMLFVSWVWKFPETQWVQQFMLTEKELGLGLSASPGFSMYKGWSQNRVKISIFKM